MLRGVRQHSTADNVTDGNQATPADSRMQAAARRLHLGLSAAAAAAVDTDNAR